MQKILFWRWKDPEPVEDVLDHVTPHSPTKKEAIKRDHKEREFFVKWHEMSYWHCEWISELALDVYHPAMFRYGVRLEGQGSEKNLFNFNLFVGEPSPESNLTSQQLSG